ncbi:MAG: uroporphyrinogen decarboxylase family protein [bacterium]
MKAMTSRERVRAAAKRQPVDRIPLMLWLEPHTTVKIATRVRPPRNPAYRGFFTALSRLGETLPTEDLRNAAPLLAYFAQADYQLELGADIVDFHYGCYPLWIKKLSIYDKKITFTDMYGIERGMGGLYIESVGNPCGTKEALDLYEFPDLSSPIHYAHIAMYRKLRPDVSIAVMCPGVQDWSQAWCGIENLYAGMIEYPETIERFFRKLAEHTLQIIRGSLRAGADIILIGDDYGTQQSMMMSKGTWERFTFPCLKRQCGEIGRLGGLAMLHSCGYVAPLLDKIAEAGVEMLHPFQPVPGNDLAAAKEEFGDRLCFMTGIDAQKLPGMSPEEVRGSMLAAARTAAPGGGFILSPTNFLQEDAPMENLRIMFNTIEDIQHGRF